MLLSHFVLIAFISDLLNTETSQVSTCNEFYLSEYKLTHLSAVLANTSGTLRTFAQMLFEFIST